MPPARRQRPLLRSSLHLLVALGLGLLVACSSLPPLPSLEGRSESFALPAAQTADTRLGRAIAPLRAAHPQLSGHFPLLEGHDAFVARALLAGLAERSLDVQYYIWQPDLTGRLLLEALHAAAERGVRVRLLLDDNGVQGLDPELAALHRHAHIEVRLFNPFTLRGNRAVGFLTDFPRLNRRMHNKSFTVDNQVSLIGGRNIGDEYFDASDGVLFADLDLLSVGPVVEEVSADFDRYWASASAYPVDRLLPEPPTEALAQLRQRATELQRQPAAAEYLQALRHTAIVPRLLDGSLALEWAPTRMVSDDPAKGLGAAARQDKLPHQLAEIIGTPQRHLELVSPYFVPTASGVESLAALAAEGVRVRVLTNSLDATDVAVVHSGYAKRRRALLAAGVELYELRRLGPPLEPRRRLEPRSSSGSSLHAKTFAVDDERVFVGSFNFDPRSARLNTELGFVIDSPALARQIEAVFDGPILRHAYQPRLDADGRLYWLEPHDGQWLRHDREPGTSLWQRLGVSLLSLLPIDWLL